MLTVYEQFLEIIKITLQQCITFRNNVNYNIYLLLIKNNFVQFRRLLESFGFGQNFGPKVWPKGAEAETETEAEAFGRTLIYLCPVVFNNNYYK